MVMNLQVCAQYDAINRILDCVKANGGQYRDWYVGLTANPQPWTKSNVAVLTRPALV